MDPLTAGLIGALAGSLLTLAGEALIQRRTRRRSFKAQMRALADEIEEVGRRAQERVTSSDQFPTGPALPTGNWRAISSSSELHLISNRYPQLSDLYRQVDGANHSSALADNFAHIALLTGDVDVATSLRQLAVQFRTEPFVGISELSREILTSQEFRKWAGS